MNKVNRIIIISIGILTVTAISIFAFLKNTGYSMTTRNNPTIKVSKTQSSLKENSNQAAALNNSTKINSDTPIAKVNNVSLDPHEVVDTSINPQIQPIRPEKDPSNIARY